MSLILWRSKSGIDYAIEFDVTVEESVTRSTQVTKHPVEQGFSVTDYVRPDVEAVSITGLVTNTPMNEPAEASEASAYVSPQSLVGLVRMAPSPNFVREYRTSTKGAHIDGGGQPPLGRLLGATVGVDRVPGLPPSFRPPKITPAEQVTTSTTLNIPTLQASSAVDRVGAIYDTLKALWRDPVLLTVSTKHEKLIPNLVISHLATPSMQGDAIRISVSFEKVRVVETRSAGLFRLSSAAKSQVAAERALPELPETLPGYFTPKTQMSSDLLRLQKGAQDIVSGR